jgi:hypothetical protein
VRAASIVNEEHRHEECCVSAGRLPTIWELVAEAAGSLPEPFSRAALINWVSARRPDVGVASIATHIQFATANSGSAGHNPFDGRTPLLRRVDRGLYERYRSSEVEAPSGEAPVRVLLVSSSGEHGPAPVPVAMLFRSPGFARARELAERSDAPWFVLSAKHGLLDPGDVVSPYDVQMDERSASYRAAWGEWVVAQLSERVPLEGVTVEVHGGVDFAQPLRQPLSRRGAALDIPLPGSWRDAEPGEQIHDEPLDSDETPVRAALQRLRSLVSGHRSPDADSGAGSPSGHATAS